MNESPKPSHFVVCLSNRGHRASLVVRRLYRALPDPFADAHGMLRVVDESGEDYLFPARLFAVVELSAGVAAKLERAA